MQNNAFSSRKRRCRSWILFQDAIHASFEDGHEISLLVRIDFADLQLDAQLVELLEGGDVLVIDRDGARDLMLVSGVSLQTS